MRRRFRRTPLVVTVVALAAALAGTQAAAEQRDLVGYVGGGLGVAVDVSDDVPGTAVGSAVDLRGGLVAQPLILELQSQYVWQEIDSDDVHTIYSGLNIMYTPFSHFEFDEEGLASRLDPYIFGGAGVAWGRAEGGDFDIDGTGVGRFWRLGGGSIFRLSESFDLDFRAEWIRSSRGSIEGLDRFQATLGFRYIVGGAATGFYKY